MVVKQSNDFNDSNGGANTFDNPTLPTLNVQTCTVPIQGTVYKDVNSNGVKDGSDTVIAGHGVSLTGGAHGG